MKSLGIALPAYTLVFWGLIFQSYYEAVTWEAYITCRQVVRVIYLGPGQKKSGLVHPDLEACEEQTQEEEEGGFACISVSAPRGTLGEQQQDALKTEEAINLTLDITPVWGVRWKWDQSFGPYRCCRPRLTDLKMGSPFPAQASGAPVAWQPGLLRGALPYRKAVAPGSCLS